jgi:hypothetical protein
MTTGSETTQHLTTKRWTGKNLTRAMRCALVIGLAFVALVACTTPKVKYANKPRGTSTSASTAQSTAADDADTDGSAAASSGSSAAPVSTSTTIAELPDPCVLLSLGQAETLAGGKLQPGTEIGPDNAPTRCQYIGDPSGPKVQVEVIVGDTAKTALDTDRANPAHKVTTLSGIGDEAYQEDDNVFLRVANIWVGINLVRGNAPAENVTPMRAAATAVAGQF